MATKLNYVQGIIVKLESLNQVCFLDFIILLIAITAIIVTVSSYRQKENNVEPLGQPYLEATLTYSKNLNQLNLEMETTIAVVVAVNSAAGIELTIQNQISARSMQEVVKCFRVRELLKVHIQLRFAL